MYRTHTCGELRPSHEGKIVTLSGWVHRRRDHGELIFIDLRDRFGLTQIVFDPKENKEAHTLAETVRSEYVLKITGKVGIRPEGLENKDLATGSVEVRVSEIEVLNKAKTPPFEIDQEKEVNEEVRLKYRYLDLRKDRLKNNILFRHKFIKRLRDLMDERGFCEVETPMLMKGTPEGLANLLYRRVFTRELFMFYPSPLNSSNNF